jgi:hypothetical protein
LVHLPSAMMNRNLVADHGGIAVLVADRSGIAIAVPGAADLAVSDHHALAIMLQVGFRRIEKRDRQGLGMALHIVNQTLSAHLRKEL